MIERQLTFHNIYLIGGSEEAKLNHRGSNYSDLVGDELEILFRDTCKPFIDTIKGLSLERRKKSNSDVDFLIKDEGITKIAIELKNWEAEAKQTWIDDEILERYKNTPTNVLKLLIAHIELKPKQIAYLTQKGILFCPLSWQVLPNGDQNKRRTVVDEITDIMSWWIVFQTGKHSRNHLSPARLNILGDREIMIEFANGKKRPINLKDKNEISGRKYGTYFSKIVKVGERPLDLISWVAGSDIGMNVLHVPKDYEVYSANIAFREYVSPNSNESLKSRFVKLFPELGGLSDKEILQTGRQKLNSLLSPNYKKYDRIINNAMQRCGVDPKIFGFLKTVYCFRTDLTLDLVS